MTMYDLYTKCIYSPLHLFAEEGSWWSYGPSVCGCTTITVDPGGSNDPGTVGGPVPKWKANVLSDRSMAYNTPWGWKNLGGMRCHDAASLTAWFFNGWPGCIYGGWVQSVLQAQQAWCGDQKDWCSHVWGIDWSKWCMAQSRSDE